MLIGHAPPPGTFDDRVATYLRVRELEGRRYPDELVASLPAVPRGHPLHAEWRARADSTRRLLNYLDALPRPRTVVDVGCGCGWLAHRMAQLEGTRVWALDATEPELEQAARVFAGQPGLTFVHGDALASEPPVAHADVVVLAAAIQYFPDLPQLVRRLLSWLDDGGELHILDSPFYAPSEVPAARARTRAYYDGLGVPEMAGAYHHHTRDDLAPFRPDYLYRPDGSSARARRALRLPASPFLWLRIRRVANP